MFEAYQGQAMNCPEARDFGSHTVLFMRDEGPFRTMSQAWPGIVRTEPDRTGSPKRARTSARVLYNEAESEANVFFMKVKQRWI